ncbi:MAG: exodeoxyribonuclease VII small subunit [Flavobacteriales bacterium]|nr:exodeoxyribonuclease VII small subunit [Flavobacteriales bacterium]
MQKKPGYTEAFNELQEIVRKIEEGQITVDELEVKVRRASELIRICKNKLTKTESDVQAIFKELQKEDETD